MRKMISGFVVTATISVLVIGAAFAAARQEPEESPAATDHLASADAAPQTETPRSDSLTTTSTPLPTTTMSGGITLPPESAYNPEGLTIPADAVISTAEQALDRALAIAQRDGADEPALEEFKLEPIQLAMEAAQRLTGENPANAMQAQEGIDPSRPVWRIVLGEAEFGHPSCPQQFNELGTPEPGGCESSPQVQYIIDSMTGQVIRSTYGWLGDPEQ